MSAISENEKNTTPMEQTEITPASPTLVTATSTSLTVQWEEIKNSTTYEIQIKSDKDKEWLTLSNKLSGNIMKKNNLKASTNYIKQRILNKESTIFICYSKSLEAAGFVQLYETFDSLNINKKLILYDLYVDKKYRRLGIGRNLMSKAKDYAIKKRIKIVELSTGIYNKKAQSLYELLDYKRDREYYNYYLEI